MKEEIFIEQPEGFNDGSGRVGKLNKSMYGLKQASKDWYDEITQFLESLGFQSTDDDPCILYNKDKSIIIILFVDDGCIVCKDESEILKILEKLSNRFEITYKKEITNKFTYLGMEVEVKKNKIYVGQSNYIRKILREFDFEDANPASTPMEPRMLTNEENFCNNYALDINMPYRQAVGSFLYLSTISRPDISFVVNFLSRFKNKPLESHWKVIKRVFQYLKSTIDYRISFNGDTRLLAYSDADYGGDLKTRRSTTGVLIVRGGPIVWTTKLQHVVATSTAEAEYRAAVLSIDELCWVRRICKELGLDDMDKPVELNVDNTSAILMLENVRDGKITNGKKHVDTSRKFIQQHIGKTVKLKHVPSHIQLADILTKPLGHNNFDRLRCKIIQEGVLN